MHDGGPRPGLSLPVDENISGTNGAANTEDSPETGLGETGAEDSGWGCVFIEPYTWPAGFPPFCGRPVLPGSPYCPAHAARCAAPKVESAAMRKRKARTPADELAPSAERLAQGLIERLLQPIADEAGRPARPYRAVDTLTAMLRKGSITPEMHQAGEDFHALFMTAQLETLRAADLHRAARRHARS